MEGHKIQEQIDGKHNHFTLPHDLQTPSLLLSPET